MNDDTKIKVTPPNWVVLAATILVLVYCVTSIYELMNPL